ncbi:DUF1523 family protein [Frateuria aurantia]
MKVIRRIAWLVLLALVIAVGAGLNYVLPEHAVVHVTGTEVKRVDKDGVVSAENPADGPTRDVYFINAVTPDGQHTRVFANDDTRFGFPWYFKFDAADQQARAQSLAQTPGQLAIVTYYGWRLRMFDMFPNAVSLTPTTGTAAPFPWFNTGLLIVVVVVLAYLSLRIRRWRKRRLATRQARAA